jgi:hydroxyacylglutathione hydrolase
MMKKLNKVERSLLTSVPSPKRLTLGELRDVLTSNRHVIDTRSKVSFAGGHIPGTINIQNNKALSTWAGWVLNYDEPFALITSEEDLDDVMRKLIRIGLDGVVGYYPNVTDWQEAGNELAEVPQIHIDDLVAHHADGSLRVVDVRATSEYEAGHIPGAMHLHAGYLQGRTNEVPRDTPVVISCQAGDRSSIAISILQREGFTNVVNFPQGFAGWKASGAPVSMDKSA